MIRPALYLGAALSLALLPGIVLAADLHDPSNTFSDLLELVRNNANHWSSRLRGFAISIFWSLATIQLVWTLGPMVARRVELGDILSELAMFVIKTAFFFSLLTYSVDWAQAIIDSFRHAGAHAAGVSTMLHPGDMFTLGVTLANTVSDVDTWNPLTGVGIMFSALVILLSFAFIAAFMAITLIESYLVINAAMIFMGFGGSQITREYAIMPFRYALAVGAKLFVLTLIVGIIMASARDWQTAYRHDSASTWTLVGMSFVLAYLSKTVTDLISGLISGVSPGSGGIMGGMAAAGMAFGAAAATTISAKLATSGMMGGGSGIGGGIANAIGSSLSGGGGGGSSASTMNPSSPPPSPSGSSGAAPKSMSSSAAAPSSGGSGPSSTKAKVFHAAHTATAGAARTGGLISSIAVPGMEGAENTSIGMSPHAFTSEPPSFDSSVQETPENVIKPEGSNDEDNRKPS